MGYIFQTYPKGQQITFILMVKLVMTCWILNKLIYRISKESVISLIKKAALATREHYKNHFKLPRAFWHVYSVVHVSNSLTRAFWHAWDACQMWKSLTAHFDTCISIHVSNGLTRVWKYSCQNVLTRVFSYTCQTDFF